MTRAPIVEPNLEWFLARDGQQYGPLKSAELEKVIELGHLKADDLVWRDGMETWEPAGTVFPILMAPPPPPPPPPPMHRPPPVQSPSPSAATPQGQAPSGGSTVGPSGAAGSGPAGRPAEPRLEAPAGPAQHQPRRAAGTAVRGDGGLHSGGAAALPQTMAAEPGRARMQAQADRLEADPRAMPAGMSGKHSHVADEDPEFLDDEPRRGWLGMAVLTIVLLAMIGGGGWYAYANRGKVKEIVASFTAGSATPKKAIETPIPGISNSIADADRDYQQSPLWRVLKSEFPKWYSDRMSEVVQLKSEKRSAEEIAQQMSRAVIELRRKHHREALAASVPKLKATASAFLNNLETLSKHSTDACYGFISQGEANPLIIQLGREAPHRDVLSAQAQAVFEAIADGRKTPRSYPAPSRADYERLSAVLKERGWTDDDMRTFADPQALAKAPPDRVCKMVKDWFAAQLAIDDQETQMRLIVEALRPVVEG